MKKFVKKLSFVMAAAMVVSSLYAPANAEAASKNFVRVKGSKKAVTSKAVFVGGRKVNFDYTVGKKTSGVKGTWMSSDTSVATVDKKTGVVKAVGNGQATITFKTAKTKKMKKVMTLKTVVRTYTRAESVMVEVPTDASVKVGKSLDLTAKLTAKKSAGTSESTYNVFAESDTTAAAVKVDGKKIMVEGKEAVATPATIKVYAAHASTLEKAKKAKYTVETEFKVAVKANFDAKQSAANKVKVMGDNLVATPSAYVLKNDKGIVANIKTVTLNADKTEAVLESFMTQFPEGKYTLTYMEKEKAEFDVVKAVVKSIKIMPEDKAILEKNNLRKATARYAVYDQFDNDITKTAIPNLRVNGKTAENNGMLTFESSTDFIPNVSKVSASIVDINTGVNAIATLTVSNASVVWKAEYKGLYDLKNKKFVESIEEKADLANFVILFEGKDQYDQPIVTKEASKQMNVILASATGLKAKALADDIQDDKYIKVGLEKLTADFMVVAGAVNVQAIIVNNGTTVAGKFDVTPSAKVDKISVPNGFVVYNNQDNEVPYTALDLEGKPVTDYKLLEMFNNAQYMVGYDAAKLRFVNKDGKAVLMFKPTLAVSEEVSAMQPISFRTMTNQFSSANLSVKFERYPKAILGIKDDVVTGVTRGGKLVLNYKDLKFQDQYGYPMTLEEFTTYNERAKAGNKYTMVYGLKAELSDAGKYFELSDNTNVFEVATATKDYKVTATASLNDANGVKADASATNKVKFTLVKNEKADGVDFSNPAAKAISSFEVPVHNVRLDDVKNFSIEKKALYPVGDLDGDAKKGVLPEVVGMYEGKKIKLSKDTNDFEVLNGVAEDGGAANKFHVKALVKADFEGKTLKTELPMKFTVIISNTAGSTVEGEYVFSIAARKVASLKLKEAGSLKLKTDKSATGWTDLKDQFEIKDQYGADIDADVVYLTFSNTSDLTVVNNSKTNTTVKIAKDTETEAKTKVKVIEPKSGFMYETEVKVTRK